jgi:hypothetical protein
MAVRHEYLAIFWTLRGPSGRGLRCAAYRVATGVELRAEYRPEDIVSTKPCRDDDADEQIAATAVAYHPPRDGESVPTGGRITDGESRAD